MSGKDLSEGFLRQLLHNGVAPPQLAHRYSLSTTQEVVIGRDPSCEIVLDSNLYGMVSRRHAAVRPLQQLPADHERFLPAPLVHQWILCDLNSSNGTFVNGQRLQGCRELQIGDRIMLGDNGAEFIFECELNYQPTQLSSSPITPTAASAFPNAIDQSVSFTQLFPIVSTGRDLTRKAYLLPGILTVVFVVVMFTTAGKPEAAYFNQILVAIYLGGAAYYFVYQLCGKHKPWWVLLASALATVLILLSPVLPLFTYVFRNVLPGRLPTGSEPVSLPELLVRMFFGAGLMEELLKALPVVGAYLVGQRLPSPWRERIGVREPLDGILLGTASAVSFTLVETLGQYVPEMIRNGSLQAGAVSVGELVGLQLLFPRILGSVAGHMAYSGYLGYFIGLSVLKPRKRWQILGVGYFTAAALHALWNSMGLVSGLLLAIVGVLSYAFLTAAILKARVLSPTRTQNFATHFLERP
jgi:RsiW-degrading membrane proteinase PrsW (M82 family)